MSNQIKMTQEELNDLIDGSLYVDAKETYEFNKNIKCEKCLVKIQKPTFEDVKSGKYKHFTEILECEHWVHSDCLNKIKKCPKCKISVVEYKRFLNGC